MDMVKNILQEELEDALELQKFYQEKIRSLPRGSLSKKKINGREYIYLQYRDGPAVVNRSLSKLSGREIKEYEKKIKQRERYQSLLDETDKKINYLRKALNVRG